MDLIDVLAPMEPSPTRLHEAVVERFTRAIVEGQLKPGDELPSEGKIATAFGVSKLVAREALRDLATLGVVHIQQGRTTRVRSLDAQPLSRYLRFAVGNSEEGFAAAIELRRILEPPAAMLAAQRRTPSQLAQLQNALSRMDAAREDVAAWVEADLDFHEQIAAMSGNRLLHLEILALRAINGETMTLFNKRTARIAADWKQTLDRHARVVDAIAAGDAAAAQAGMLGHFGVAEVALKEIFQKA